MLLKGGAFVGTNFSLNTDCKRFLINDIRTFFSNISAKGFGWSQQYANISPEIADPA